VASKSICILPHLHGSGGPSSFQTKLKSGLKKRGIQAHHDPSQEDTATILVIGGTHNLIDLFHARKRGVRIVQRLDGMNWLHKKTHTGLHHYLRSEWFNWNLATIRKRFAHHIVYQSKFSRDWWQTEYKSVRTTSNVIYNGVNLKTFNPQGSGMPPIDHFRLLVVENSFHGGYERGLFNALNFTNSLSKKLKKMIKLTVAGKVPKKIKGSISLNQLTSIRWMGLVPHKSIPELDRSAHLLFSADINAACPNSVIEALACGLPVVSYATGSLPELIDQDAGRVVPYGSNYWNLESPNTSALVKVSIEVLNNQSRFRKAARKRAETLFNVNQMVENYIKVLLK